MLISESYKAAQEQMHRQYEYGTAGKLYAPIVAKIIDKLGITHLLDYGCSARMSLLKGLEGHLKAPFKYQGYDPCAGVEELATAPIPAQMVACIDVLEHIEPECLDNVLDHLKAMTEEVAFLTIHTGPAQKLLPDGRNAHLTQEPLQWWLPKLWSRWDIQTVQVAHENGFYVIAFAKQELHSANGESLTEDPKIYLQE